MFVHVSFPLLANLYLICTLLSTIFSLGDFNSVYFVTGGGPARSTHVLATLGIRYAFDLAQPRLGVAAVISALPLLIPLVIILMRKFRTARCSYEHDDLGDAADRDAHGRCAGCAAAALAVEALAAVLSVVLLIWTVAAALQHRDGLARRPQRRVHRRVWPPHPSFDGFWVVFTEGYWYLENFWHQFGNSLYRRRGDDVPDPAIASVASFSISPDAHPARLAGLQRRADDLCDPGLVPGDPVLSDHADLRPDQQSVVGHRRLVTFATPYAMFIFQQYGRSIPIELDELARIDGASPMQIYFRIYLPLMAPALVAVGTYALLLAWNEYLYQFLMLSDKRSMTVPVALAQFLNSDEAPWNYMMATAVVYALPPTASITGSAAG